MTLKFVQNPPIKLIFILLNQFLKFWINMNITRIIGLVGFEPTTFCTQSRCNTELYNNPKSQKKKKIKKNFSSYRFPYSYLVTTSSPLSIQHTKYNFFIILLINKNNLIFLRKPTSETWRAVCARFKYIFTATCWFAITSDSYFIFSSFRK